MSFDWFGEGAANIVIEEQPLTAVYVNPAGSIVIRQYDPDGEESDPYIVIRPEYAEALGKRLVALAKSCGPRQLNLLEAAE